MAKQKPAIYRGSYHVQARKVRNAALADPFHTCWRCHLTLTQARQRWGNHIKWHAGHRTPNDVGGILEAECSHCNIVESNLRRQGKVTTRRTTLTW